MQNPLFIKSGVAPTEYLSVEYIFSIKAILEEKRRLYEKLPGEIEELEKRYKAAIVFAPPNFDANKPPKAMQTEGEAPASSLKTKTPVKPVGPPKAEKSIGWRKGLQILLGKEVNGISHQPLLKLSRDTYKFPKSVGEKGFYNAVAKLINAGDVVKHGNLLFSKTIYEKLKKNGDLPSVPEMQRRSGSSAELIQQVLKEHTDGLTVPQLRKILGAMPSAPKSLREHGQYVYNILGTMMGSGEVSKNDGVYKLTALPGGK